MRDQRSHERSRQRACVGIGKLHGNRRRQVHGKFGLAAVPSEKVGAPLIDECYANFECRLADASLISKYGLFIREVREGACREPFPKVSGDAPLPRRRCIHGLGTINQSAQEIQTGEPVSITG